MPRAQEASTISNRLLRATGVKKRFYKRAGFGRPPEAYLAVDDVDLEVSPGEVFALIGETDAARLPWPESCWAC